MRFGLADAHDLSAAASSRAHQQPEHHRHQDDSQQRKHAGPDSARVRVGIFHRNALLNPLRNHRVVGRIEVPAETIEIILGAVCILEESFQLIGTDVDVVDFPVFHFFEKFADLDLLISRRNELLEQYSQNRHRNHRNDDPKYGFCLFAQCSGLLTKQSAFCGLLYSILTHDCLFFKRFRDTFLNI